MEISVTAKKILIILAGIPYSGKSTFRDYYLKDFATISIDDLVHLVAEEQGKTYNEVWASCVKKCSSKAKALCHTYKDTNTVIDMTNLTAKKRRTLIKDYANGRYVVCVYFSIPEPEELANRVLNRPSQTISPNLLKNMADMYVYPTLEEGFDAIYTPEQFIEEIKK